MKRLFPCVAFLLLMAPSSSVAETVESRTLRETFPLAGAGASLTVDNLYGSIVLRAHDGDSVRMVAEETIRARSGERIERARREVTLDITNENGELVLFVDGPFRDRHDRSQWSRNHRNPGYRVEYDFELEVPRRIDLYARTVEGDIRIEGIDGRFDVNGVNGRVTMTDVAGSGRAATVNGPVLVRFVENPTADTEFRTINGKLDVTFQDGLSADLRLKTMNGEMLSDFRFSTLPPSAPEKEINGGQTRIRTDRWASVRIASGGPQLTFENINGNILVRRGEP